MDVWTILLTSSLISALISSILLMVKDIYINRKACQYKKKQERRADLKEVLEKLTCYQDNIDVDYYSHKIDDEEKRMENMVRVQLAKFYYFRDKYEFCKIYLGSEDRAYLDGLLIDLKIYDFHYLEAIKSHQIKDIKITSINITNKTSFFEERLIEIIQEYILNIK